MRLLRVLTSLETAFNSLFHECTCCKAKNEDFVEAKSLSLVSDRWSEPAPDPIRPASEQRKVPKKVCMVPATRLRRFLPFASSWHGSPCSCG